MAIYYVKSGGTATGDAGRETTARTGAFESAANNYDSFEDVMSVPTTAMVGLDEIRCSDLHNKEYGASTTINFPSVADAVNIYSVDDANQDQFKAGANDGLHDLIIWQGSAYCRGVGVSTDSSFTVSSSGSAVYMEDGVIVLETSSDFIRLGSDGCTLTCVNMIFDFQSTGQRLRAIGGSTAIIIGGEVSGPSVTDVWAGDFSSGGAEVVMIGVDLSAATDFILGQVGSSPVSADAINFRITGCQVNASLTGFVEEVFSSPNHYFLATNCAATSAAAEFQFFQRTWAGDVEDQDDTGIHRDESTAFPSGEKVSMKVTTVAACTPQRDLVFDLPARFAELSTASTDTIRIFFAVVNTTTLTDQDVWAELIYPDGTNKHIYNYLSNRNTDPFAAGTTHTDDSGSSTWKDGVSDLTGHNEYRMDLDTSGDVGADSVPIIRIHAGIASQTIYFDTSVGVVA